MLVIQEPLVKMAVQDLLEIKVLLVTEGLLEILELLEQVVLPVRICIDFDVTIDCKDICICSMISLHFNTHKIIGTLQ